MMSITFSCEHCGATYRPSEALIGRSVRCKRCGKSVPIAAADPTDTLFEGPGVSAKPSIQPEPETYALAEAPLAATWGTGNQEPASTVASSSTFRPAIADKSRRKRKQHPTDLPDIRGWLIGGAFLLVAVLGPLAYYNTAARGGVLFVTFLIGLALAISGNMKIAERVLDEDIFRFWLFVVFPYYSLYYMVTRWDDVKGPLLVSVAGYLLVFGSLLLLKATVF
jgi:hypothetical protein